MSLTITSKSHDLELFKSPRVHQFIQVHFLDDKIVSFQQLEYMIKYCDNTLVLLGRTTQFHSIRHLSNNQNNFRTINVDHFIHRGNIHKSDSIHALISLLFNIFNINMLQGNIKTSVYLAFYATESLSMLCAVFTSLAMGAYMQHLQLDNILCIYTRVFMHLSTLLTFFLQRLRKSLTSFVCATFISLAQHKCQEFLEQSLIVYITNATFIYIFYMSLTFSVAGIINIFYARDYQRLCVRILMLINIFVRQLSNSKS